MHLKNIQHHKNVKVKKSITSQGLCSVFLQAANMIISVPKDPEYIHSWKTEIHSPVAKKSVEKVSSISHFNVTTFDSIKVKTAILAI